MPSRKRKSVAPDTPLTLFPRRFSISLWAKARSRPRSSTVVRRFKKAIVERALGGELTHHLGIPLGVPNRRTSPIIAMGRAPRPS
jgi:hypothetical protein